VTVMLEVVLSDYRLGTSYEVTGYVKPNADLRHIYVHNERRD